MLLSLFAVCGLKRKKKKKIKYSTNKNKGESFTCYVLYGRQL